MYTCRAFKRSYFRFENHFLLSRLLTTLLRAGVTSILSIAAKFQIQATLSLYYIQPILTYFRRR